MPGRGYNYRIKGIDYFLDRILRKQKTLRLIIVIHDIENITHPRNVIF